jgi:hypothetical protein
MEDNEANSGYNIADFQRYKQGSMSAKDQHAFEKKCMEDPFVADAYEGYLLLAEKNIDAANHFQALEDKLDTLTIRETRKIAAIWYYSSAAILIFGVGLSLIAYFKSDMITKPTQIVVAAKENTTLQATDNENYSANESESSQKQFQVSKSRRKPQVSSPEPDSDRIAAIDVPPHELSATDGIVNLESEAQRSPSLTSDFQNFGLRRAVSTGKQLNITGKVIHDGAFVSGVRVTNSGVSVVSDEGGRFSVPGNPGDSVFLSMIGFEPKKLRVTKTELGTLSLSADTNLLSEVSVGYGKRVEKTAEHGSQARPNSVGAEPKNGWREYEKYLKESAKSEAGQGSVSISFIVSETGDLSDFETQGNSGLFEAAKRIVRNGPAWLPASVNGAGYADRIHLTLQFGVK